MLKAVQKLYSEREEEKKGGFDQTEILNTYNKHFAASLAISALQLNQLYEIVMYLQESGILRVGSRKGVKNMMLSKKRVSGINASGKKFTVELNVDIKELE